MIAGHSGVRQDVPPYTMVAGFQSRAVGVNQVGLQRHGISPADRQALRRAFHLFFRARLSMDAALEAIEREDGDSVPVQHFLAFVRASRERNRGIVRWQNETAS
jgi:UDP-N-acetylglucosamine acyltransferase